MDKGFIKLSRTFFDNDIWQAARAFNEGEAWLDLIQLARFETSEITSRIGSYEVTWGRGQYPASNRFLAKKWGRTDRWVKTFLGKLKKKGMISVENTQGLNVITLLNFDKYNDIGESRSDPPSDPLNALSNSELRALVTHLLTHPTVKSAEKGCENAPFDPPSDPLNALSNSELRAKATHQVTHPFEKRPTTDPNTKKDKEYIPPYNPPNTPSPTHTREENSENEISQIWAEDMCMRFHIMPETLREYYKEFSLECRCKEIQHTSETDKKRHFHDWLRIQINNSATRQKVESRHKSSNYMEQADRYARETGLTPDAKVRLIYKDKPQ